MKYKVGIVSLGCDKNRVDSEIILGKVKSDYEITNNPKEADIIIVNTCGFIEKAKQESINTILDMAKYKEKYNCKLLIATGCLTQRYGEELKEEMPEIDVMLGVNDYDKINQSIIAFIKEDKRALAVSYKDTGINEGERVITTGKSTAYIRIAEGCNNFCTYCVIPKIRGKYRSRNFESIIDEAKILASQGVKELIVIAQDTTNYGVDLYGKRRIHELIRELSKIDSIEWIRLMYSYPEAIEDELLKEMAENEKVCKYMDIPIQHISSSILKRMGRRTTKEEIISKINKIRSYMNDVTLRTSIIVGFPGETEQDFEELKNFIKEIKLDKVGVFTYSQEEDTPASIMDNQVDEHVKVSREQELMLIQREVSKEINNNKIGKKYKVLIEAIEDGSYIGRNFEMAPEVDGAVFVKEKDLIIGNFYEVNINSALEYDLVGVVDNESSK
ncbi:SSU ribosomal protein S12P methylthiotransferase [Clostridium cavendishii DSM 21758]|uniref:Ribosomal protein uS12 methylthiotransferase RimO n=1 Tax=Clostridium cavendishii DSM 21758 TaxID=1121302 RepID=A0A1M6RPG6_9CLOT|nr:30S ribosomal protein S12 methylthiotransferase RimO [Clostridium cavendishii]SHK34217.1 SSU ribosomal protein S12P methylthiotransferase [Clostridium cavendishii DSM 21758]